MPIICYECHEVGHKSFECPKRASNQVQTIQPKIDMMQEEVNPNARVMVLLQQRECVFYTSANIAGSKQQLLIIVDSGCTNNLILEEVVAQMGWVTMPHPKPYPMGWLFEGHEIRVSRKCMVTFKIGNYRNEVKCDVMAMGICDLLLGRPWQSDHDTCHKGRLNTYTMRMQGCHVRLWPMKSDDPYDYLPMCWKDGRSVHACVQKGKEK